MRLPTLSWMLLLSLTSRALLPARAWRASSSPRALVTPNKDKSASVKRNMASTATLTSLSSPNNAVEVRPFQKPDRVVPDQLPTLFCYDHCPFCVRVRFVLGVKNIKHRLHFLANDDVDTPKSLVGKKISPIFQWKKTNMAESMDIVKFIDSSPELGEPNVLLPATERTDLQAWQSGTRDLLRSLQRPRYVATGLLPEFQQLDGRHAYITNHALPPYSADEWNGMSLEEQIAAYAEAMANDPADNLEELNRKLIELDDVITCEHHCSPGGLSLDDVDLFSRLRSITIIDDVEWPAKLRAYMDTMAQLADIPLYDEMAL